MHAGTCGTGDSVTASKDHAAEKVPRRLGKNGNREQLCGPRCHRTRPPGQPVPRGARQRAEAAEGKAAA